MEPLLFMQISSIRTGAEAAADWLLDKHDRWSAHTEIPGGRNSAVINMAPVDVRHFFLALYFIFYRCFLSQKTPRWRVADLRRLMATAMCRMCIIRIKMSTSTCNMPNMAFMIRSHSQPSHGNTAKIMSIASSGCERACERNSRRILIRRD